ncbi:MAG: DnaD domain protein [Clostridiales Family XIII bacterium]|jgi:DnaD/phage-associated family protein|nr:DnaD domain protein [Clostridiales Family XIII bacterium]
MLFKREITREYYLGDTHVENIFINEMMAGAPGDYVKVYLFALMYTDLGMIMGNPDIARHLSMPVEDVLKAWSYWEEQGVAKKHYEDPGNKLLYTVEFLNLKSRVYGRQASKNPSGALPPDVKDLLANEDLRALCIEVESIVGSPLSPSELQATMSWVTELGAAAPVVAYAYRYAADKNRQHPGAPERRTNYVAKIVKTWTEKGFRSVAEVNQYLEENDNRHYQYKRILRALGMSRGAAEEEKRIMDVWFDEMRLTLDAVLEACKKVSGITNPNINYINAVLNPGSAAAKKKSADGGKNQIAEVYRHYERLRNKEEQDADGRRKEVYARVPEIREKDALIHRHTMDISKLMLSGAGNAHAKITALRKQIEALQHDKAFLMTENNFRPDYMDVLYTCAICKDTGTKDSGEQCACFSDRLAELS